MIFGVALATGLLLGRGGAVPGGIVSARIVGALAVTAGATLGISALVALKRAGTNVRPDMPATVFVTNGPFRYSRNPAYLGATSMYVRIALAARSLPALALLPFALAVMERGVVGREERYLLSRFGDAYRRYQDEVPRWV